MEDEGKRVDEKSGGVEGYGSFRQSIRRSVCGSSCASKCSFDRGRKREMKVSALDSRRSCVVCLESETLADDRRVLE
jgi:hypothetical protein